MYYPEGAPLTQPTEPTVATVEETEPEEIETEIAADLLPGKQVYDTYCLPCHMPNGMGAPGMNPPLVGTEWVLGDKERIIKVVLQGLNEPVEIKGEIYQNAMASHAFLSDQQIADVLTYVRQSWGNDAEAVEPREVARVRARVQ
jgi:mono/diheme cytochrome c family protein